MVISWALSDRSAAPTNFSICLVEGVPQLGIKMKWTLFPGPIVKPVCQRSIESNAAAGGKMFQKMDGRHARAKLALKSSRGRSNNNHTDWSFLWVRRRLYDRR